MIATPVIVVTNASHANVLFFETPTAAALYMEPIDVRDHEYRAYDGHGYDLVLATGKDDRGVECVGISAPAERVSHAADVQALIEHLLGRSAVEVPSGATLATVVAVAIRSFGYTV